MKIVLHARFDERHVRKLDKLKAQTGLTVSQIFRELVDRAEVKPLDVTVDLSANANDDTHPGQGNSVVVAA